jgi:SAM-dependent MidA family methyltransferase
VVIDYADTTPSMATRQPWEWVRTYRLHGRGEDPLTDLGLQDVTCEVAVDQVAAARPLALDQPQADFLRAHGIDALVDEARAQWEAAAAAPTVEALKSRSRVAEAAALLDPTGLGAFRVLEWAVNR